MRFPHKSNRNPIFSLRADHAWRAADSVARNGVTSYLVPYLGSVVLSKTGTGQSVSSVLPAMANAPAVQFNGAAGAAGYAGSFSTPTALTVVTVFRPTATSSAAHSLTVGGTANTGTADGMSGANAFSQKVGTAALKAQAVNANIVLLSTFNSSGSTIYPNSLTGSSAALAGALAGNTFCIGSLSSPTGTFTLTGYWVETGVWRRVLTAAEIELVMRRLGSLYSIPIAA